MTEVLRELVREARQRVDKTVYVGPKPKLVTPEARQKGRLIRSLWKQMNLAKKTLAKSGFEVGMPRYYVSRDKIGKVTASSLASQSHKAAFERAQGTRRELIDAYRRYALVDTIGMPRAEMVAYMRTLQKKLAAV